MAVGNPNHPVVRSMETEWHKIVALLMMRLGVRDVEVTTQDLLALDAWIAGGAVVADARRGEFWIRIMDDATASRLARREGGLAS